MSGALKQLWPIGVAVMLGLLGGYVMRLMDGGPATSSAAQSGETSGAPPEAAVSPEKQALTAVQACRTLRDFARLGPLLESLDNAQIGALLDDLERRRHLGGEEFITVIVRWWAGRDATATAAWLGPALRRFLNDSSDIAGRRLQDEPLIEAWAEAADPVAVLEYVRPYTRKDSTTLFLSAAMKAWPDSSPEGRLRALRELPPGKARSWAIMRTIDEWLAKVPDENLREMLPRVTAGLDEIERWNAFSRLGKMKSALEAVGLALEFGVEPWRLLLEKAGPQSWDATAAWLAQQSDDSFHARAVPFGRDWVQLHPVAGLDWALANGVLSTPPEPPFREELGERTRPTVWQAALLANPAPALAWLAEQPPGPFRDSLVEVAANSPIWTALMEEGVGNSVKRSAGPEDEKTVEELRKKRAAVLASLDSLAVALPDEAATFAGFSMVANLRPQGREEVDAWAAGLPPGALREAAELAVADALEAEAFNKPQLALPVEGKPGFVRSPHDKANRPIDVRGLPPGIEVEDPYIPGKTLVLP
jgi:hypothetical protein